jgi:hypothetical protein
LGERGRGRGGFFFNFFNFLNYTLGQARHVQQDDRAGFPLEAEGIGYILGNLGDHACISAGKAL